MNYLLREQIEPFLNRGKSIEQLIGFEKREHFNTIKWISVYKDKDYYCLDFHEVFDEREDGNINVYDYSYVDPDDMYGKRIFETENYIDLLGFAKERYNIAIDKFMPFDYLNDELKNK